MTEASQTIHPPENVMFKGKKLLPIDLKFIYEGKHNFGTVKKVKIGDDTKQCYKLKNMGIPFPDNHCFVTQIDELKKNDQKVTKPTDPAPLIAICVNCGCSILDGQLVKI